MSRVMSEARPPIAAATLRNDTWWALPLTVVVVLGSFIVYSTWAALQNALLRSALSLAVLLPVHLEIVPALDVRLGPARHDVSRHRDRVPGVPDPVGPGALSADLLLLPQGVLPLVLAGAASLRRARRQGRLQRRDAVSVVPAELPSLRVVRRRGLHRVAHVGRRPGLSLPDGGRRPSVRYGRGHAGHVDQRGPPRRLYVLLPLVPSRLRR